MRKTLEQIEWEERFDSNAKGMKSDIKKLQKELLAQKKLTEFLVNLLRKAGAQIPASLTFNASV